MENAKWNGNFYTATEIAESYELEKIIRKASGRKELRCVDPDCNSPILRYCHGEIKCAFFAHLNNCTCDYAEFDKENTQVIRQVKRNIFNNFSSRGLDVQLEVKLLPRHYTHLLFTIPNGKKIAVELGTQRTTANKIEYLSEQYKNIDIDVKWIVVSNFQTPVKENETFFIKRYLLNESKMKDILILNWDGTEVTQYIVDPNEYRYNGKNLRSVNYPDIYSETTDLSQLVFDDEELCIEGFYSRYQGWLVRKRKAFNKKIAETEEVKSRLLEQKKRIQAEREKELSKQRKLEKPKEVSYEGRRNSVLPQMDQLTKLVIDDIGVRWLKCEKCGAIETEDKFWSYGGQNYLTRGICNKCK